MAFIRECVHNSLTMHLRPIAAMQYGVASLQSLRLQYHPTQQWRSTGGENDSALAQSVWAELVGGPLLMPQIPAQGWKSEEETGRPGNRVKASLPIPLTTRRESYSDCLTAGTRRFSS